MDVVGSDAFRGLGYAAAAAASLFAYQRERKAEIETLIPETWLVFGVVLAVMALFRSVGMMDGVTQFGREQARSEGWYEARRILQWIAIAGGGAGLVTGVVLTVRYLPGELWRYAPMAGIVLFLVFFAFIRLFSLHYLDGPLYTHDLGDLPNAVWVEVGACCIAVGVAGLAAMLPHDRKRKQSLIGS